MDRVRGDRHGPGHLLGPADRQGGVPLAVRIPGEAPEPLGGQIAVRVGLDLLLPQHHRLRQIAALLPADARQDIAVVGHAVLGVALGDLLEGPRRARPVLLALQRLAGDVQRPRAPVGVDLLALLARRGEDLRCSGDVVPLELRAAVGVPGDARSLVGVGVAAQVGREQLGRPLIRAAVHQRLGPLRQFQAGGLRRVAAEGLCGLPPLAGAGVAGPQPLEVRLRRRSAQPRLLGQRPQRLLAAIGGVGSLGEADVDILRLAGRAGILERLGGPKLGAGVDGRVCGDLLEGRRRLDGLARLQQQFAHRQRPVVLGHMLGPLEDRQQPHRLGAPLRAQQRPRLEERRVSGGRPRERRSIQGHELLRGGRMIAGRQRVPQRLGRLEQGAQQLRLGEGHRGRGLDAGGLRGALFAPLCSADHRGKEQQGGQRQERRGDSSAHDRVREEEGEGGGISRKEEPRMEDRCSGGRGSPTIASPLRRVRRRTSTAPLQAAQPTG